MASKSTKSMVISMGMAAAVFLSASAFVPAATAAPITFEHVCVSPAACDNDADFAFTITLDGSVVSPNGSYDTSDDGGVAFLGWTGASSVGDGFTIAGGLADTSVPFTGITFNFGANAVLTEILSNVGGTLIDFTGSEGIIFYSEAGIFTDRFDFSPLFVIDSDDIIASWRVVSIAEPAAFLPLSVGLLSLAAIRRRKRV